VAAPSFDFFAQQEAARRATWRLLGLYLLAAAAVVASYCALAWLLLAIPYLGLRGVPAEAVWSVGAAVSAVIVAASAARAWQLREGGMAVAQLLGARYVDPFKCNPAERRLINVVEEMAIASGVAVPPVYALEREDAVNALVAGTSPNEAVIIVTRGALQKLSRDELQAIMGHEYSHILNGDMALNVRLVAILAGLSWLGDRGEEMVWRAAEITRKEGREGGTAAPSALFGALLALVGFPGVFAAGAIRAAISRQRELLADQASVQFTRNPDGIAGALDSILATSSHTVVRTAHAAELAHMFFAPAVAHWWSAPTHPPIERRIRLAHPRFDRAGYRERRHGRRSEVAVLDGSGTVVKTVGAGGLAAAPAAAAAAQVDHAVRLLAAIPSALREALHRAEDAQAVMLALAGRADAKGLQALAKGVGREHMLTLAQLAIPALKEQPQKARDAFLAELARAVQEDRRVTLSEFVLFTYLRQHLREGAGKPIATKFRSLEDVGGDAHVVLSLVCLAAADPQGAYARGNAILGLPAAAPLPASALDTPRLGEALERLRHLAPLRKPAVLKACFEAAAADGTLRLAEADLVRMVAATLDCPVPPALAARDPASLAA
jgi:Zn-dependent protease with chaperone function